MTNCEQKVGHGATYMTQDLTGVADFLKSQDFVKTA